MNWLTHTRMHARTQLTLLIILKFLYFVWACSAGIELTSGLYAGSSII